MTSDVKQQIKRKNTDVCDRLIATRWYIKILFKSILQIKNVSASYSSVPEIHPHIPHIISHQFFPSSIDSRSCQLLGKEWALDTGKLPPKDMPTNSVVK